jgi:O-antigen ligase
MNFERLNNQKKFDLRLLLVYFVAASVGLSMAWISIGKLVLFVFGAGILIWSRLLPNGRPRLAPSHIPQHTVRAIGVALIAFSLSLFWTTAQSGESLGSINKYGKLLTILLLPMLLRSRQEVIQAITVFVVLQAALAISSWLLFFGMPVPWATSKRAVTEFSVFSTYLDQSIMSAVTAALCWHLRGFAPTRFGKYAAITIAVICMSNVLFALIGRSGHIVAIVLLSLAIMWELPRRYRWLLVVLPIPLLTAAFALSPKVQLRVMLVKSEVQAFSFDKGESVVTGTSSGIRLHFWHRAVQSIAQSPLLGSGVGSWSNEYNRLEKQQNPGGVMLGERSNPHQEYLMWGVQLGGLGIVLFLGFLLSVLRDTWHADTPAQRAAQSVLAALAVSCLFNSSIYDALIGDFFCVALGLTLALASYRSPRVTLTTQQALKAA